MTSKIDRIKESVRNILDTIPEDVQLIAAAKTRSLEEVEAAIQAGVTHIGYNYVQEALPIIQAVGSRVSWHMIGHLQRNKAKQAVRHFDIIETLDSYRLAKALDKRSAEIGKKFPVLIEINSGKEQSKTGILAESVDEFVAKLTSLENIEVMGLMTMGPMYGDPENSRPYFKATRQVFERLGKLDSPNIKMRYLSMGMSNSYQVAIEEGANIIRVGTKLFGERET